MAAGAAGVLLLITGSATLGVLSAFFARGGAIFRLLGIAVVGQAGREVSRLSRRPRADRVGPWHCRASAPPAIWRFAIGGRSSVSCS